MSAYQRFGTGNMILPPEGPSIVPINVDFSTAAAIQNGVTVDLNFAIQNGVLSEIQGMFIDNADNPNKLTCVVAITNQRIICPPNAQLYVPLFVSSSPQFFVTTTLGAPIFVAVAFYNVPIYPLLIK